MEQWATYLGVGSFILSLVITTISLFLQNKVKVSEYRYQYLLNLREAFSQYTLELETLRYAINNNLVPSNIPQMLASRAKIELYAKPENDIEFENLSCLMGKISLGLASSSRSQVPIDDTIKQMRKILKRTWGEIKNDAKFPFNVTSLSCLVIILIFGMGFWLGSYYQAKENKTQPITLGLAIPKVTN